MAELLLGHSWAVAQLAPCEGLVSIGRQHGKQAIQVPWGRRAQRVFGVEKILKWFVLQMHRSVCRKAAIWQQKRATP